MIPPIVARIRAEEALLPAQSSREHDAYCVRISLLIPGLY
jgi:protein-S-isoprenylcysteine O-methyltransferase Ste14